MKLKEKHPWKRQRILKKEDIPIQEQLLQLVMGLDEPKHRALFILCYLTAGRISEIVPKKFLYRNTYKWIEGYDRHGNPIRKVDRSENGTPLYETRSKVELNYRGICKNNILFTEKKGKKIMIISMQNRKNPSFKRKNLPIPIDKERVFIDILKDYLVQVADNAPLFDFGVSKAEEIIGWTGMNPHFLRDIRLTHMVTIYDFNAFQLARFAGWKNSAPAERYVRLGYSDLIDKF